MQRYEGGFTLFGPHTLDAYIQVRMGEGLLRCSRVKGSLQEGGGGEATARTVVFSCVELVP